MQTIFNGQLNYVNAQVAIQYLRPPVGTSSLQALDPGRHRRRPGFARVPADPRIYSSSAAPTTLVGDGLNTSGLYFVSPVRNTDNTYIGRLDYQFNAKHRLFARATFRPQHRRRFQWQTPSRFSPATRTRAPVMSITRVPGSLGRLGSFLRRLPTRPRSVKRIKSNAFAINYKPTFPNSVNFFDSFYGDIFSDPYLGLNEQFPVVPVYQLRDTVSWVQRQASNRVRRRHFSHYL